LQIDGHALVLAQMVDDEPAVLEIRLSYRELLALGARVAEARHPDFTAQEVRAKEFDVTKYDLSKMVQVLEDLTPFAELQPQADKTLPELAVPLPFALPAGSRLHMVPRHVPWDVYAYLLGLDGPTFIELAERGQFRPWGC
jgi:hypothetical protein